MASVRKAATKKAAKKAVAKKKIAKKTVAKRAVVKKAAPKKKVAAKKTVAKKKAPAKKAAPRRVTAKKALANTRKLLKQKQAQARETPPWQALETPHDTGPQPGFQSDEARVKAGELHQAEARLDAIHGSASTVGRHNQGKRDQR